MRRALLLACLGLLALLAPAVPAHAEETVTTELSLLTKDNVDGTIAFYAVCHARASGRPVNTMAFCRIDGEKTAEAVMLVAPYSAQVSCGVLRPPGQICAGGAAYYPNNERYEAQQEKCNDIDSPAPNGPAMSSAGPVFDCDAEIVDP